MYTFNNFVLMRETNEPAPPGVDPETWAYASDRMKNILRAQAQGAAYQAPQAQATAAPTYQVRRAARALGPVGPVQGQTGQGLESIRPGGRVPPHLVAQIPAGDIAPSMWTATKFWRGKDGSIYKK